MRSRSSSVQFITAGHSIQPRLYSCLYDFPGYLHACRTALQDNGLQKKMKPGILQFSHNQAATRD